MSTHPSRRTFLQTTAALAGSLVLPRNLLTTPAPTFFFIHANSCNSWPIPNPVVWSLENAREPILERAAEGLSKLTVNDGERIVRLVVRRCSLNLLEVLEGRVVVHHWGQNRADLCPFFKTHGLARQDVQVLLRDRKKEITSTKTGDDFLYGVPLAPQFDLDLFQKKWVNRFKQEADDLEAAPNTSSGFAWEGLPDGSAPWAALKSAWRRAGSGVCLNCSGRTFLVNFGLRQVGMFNRAGLVEYVCGTCRRSYRDSVGDVGGWMAVNLDEGIRPGYEMVRGNPVKMKGNA